MWNLRAWQSIGKYFSEHRIYIAPGHLAAFISLQIFPMFERLLPFGWYGQVAAVILGDLVAVPTKVWLGHAQ
jgi:hypothetical protein